MPPRIRTPKLPAHSIHSQFASNQWQCSTCLRRGFSSTPQTHTRLRREMFAWLDNTGKNFRHPLPQSTNYLSAYDRRGGLIRAAEPEAKQPGAAKDENPDAAALKEAAEGDTLEKESDEDLRPFPLNNTFISQSILSEELRQEIWRRVQAEGKSVREVSVELGIEMRRVGAVVRLTEVERRWRAEGKPLAIPYARAIHAMLPTTPYTGPPNPPQPHESINDLPVHALTDPQLFYPTSESRAFNRVDAGRVFSAAPRLPDEQDIGQGGTPAQEMWRDTRIETIGKKGHERTVLKAADSRIPHPHLIALEKDKLSPSVYNQPAVAKRYVQRLRDDQDARRQARERKKDREEKTTIKIETDRWEFKFKEVQATRSGTGLDGRGTGSPGYRYAVPSQERKRGQVKIPTKVEV